MPTDANDPEQTYLLHGVSRASEYERVVDAVERASGGGDGIVAAARSPLALRPIRPQPGDVGVTDATVDPEQGRGDGENDVQHARLVASAGADRQLRRRPRGLRGG